MWLKPKRIPVYFPLVKAKRQLINHYQLEIKYQKNKPPPYTFIVFTEIPSLVISYLLSISYLCALKILPEDEPDERDTEEKNLWHYRPP